MDASRPFSVPPPDHSSADGAAVAGLSPLQILDQAQAGRIVLQDYRPLADSLEWELGKEYLKERGSLAFIGDAEPVPFVVNNDGSLSMKAAEVFFTSLLHGEQAGTLPDDLFVLELGIGVGLFARYFLDWFERLCRQHGKDFYDRLCYVAADTSPRMLRDACRHGVFLNHPGRYRLRLADALCPERTLLADADIARLAPRPFRAVFLNYLLDCLPACVLKVEGNEIQQLHARTSLPAAGWLAAQLDVGEEELRQLAASPDPAQRREVLAVYPSVVSEYQYLPAKAEEIPYGEFALAQARQAEARPILHNHGALRCLEALYDLLGEGGVILINDYGQAREATAEGFEHQRFSLATFVAVNFPLLGRYFTGRGNATWWEPDEGEASVHARLLGRDVDAETARRFQTCFSQKTQEWVEGPVRQAREFGGRGRFQSALGQYREALQRQPFNWVLMNEVAQFLTFPLGNPAAGLEMAKAALEHNPASSADLWNMLGDCLFELRRVGDARLASDRALEISPDDVRARYNLAFIHVAVGEYQEALVRLAEGLGRDRAGVYRDRLLQKQREVLTLLHQQNQRRNLRQADRVVGAATAGPVRAEAEVALPGRPAVSEPATGKPEGNP